eukprot:Sspe_Gene.2118::Locus_701_Transcript_1_1_Confidence_1.000_Length_1777::g.2118::m.2118
MLSKDSNLDPLEVPHFPLCAALDSQFKRHFTIVHKAVAITQRRIQVGNGLALRRAEQRFPVGVSVPAAGRGHAGSSGIAQRRHGTTPRPPPPPCPFPRVLPDLANFLPLLSPLLNQRCWLGRSKICVGWEGSAGGAGGEGGQQPPRAAEGTANVPVPGEGAVVCNVSTTAGAFVAAERWGDEVRGAGGNRAGCHRGSAPSCPRRRGGRGTAWGSEGTLPRVRRGGVGGEGRGLEDVLRVCSERELIEGRPAVEGAAAAALELRGWGRGGGHGSSALYAWTTDVACDVLLCDEFRGDKELVALLSYAVEGFFDALCPHVLEEVVLGQLLQRNT